MSRSDHDPNSSARRPRTQPWSDQDGPDGDGPDPLNLPTELARRVRLIGPLGEADAGGQGMLYRGTYQRPGEPEWDVVVKRTLVYATSDNEWQYWKAADPRHVVRLIDHAATGGARFEVTEYLQHGSLNKWLHHIGRAGQPMPDQLARTVLRELAEALHHVQQVPKRVGGATFWVHRDIKPANVLVRGTDPLDLCLTDFGAAQPQAGKKEISAIAALTPIYASPEAIYGMSTPASDWWSVGMTMLELLQGRHPFIDDNGAPWKTALVSDRLRNDRPPFDEVVSLEWRGALSSLMAWDPDDRWRRKQVLDWLDGGSPVVIMAYAPRPDHRGEPYSFDGRTYDGVDKLAEAMAANWEKTATLIIGSGWTTLLDWSVTVPRDLRPRLEEVQHRFIDRRAPVDRTVSELLVRLNPTGAPRFRGWRVDTAGLVQLADAAARHEPDAEVLDALYRTDSLHAFGAGAMGHADLIRINSNWHRLYDKAKALLDGTQISIDELPGLQAMLLHAAASPDYVRTLAELARESQDRTARRAAFFRAWADTAEGQDAPAHHAVMVLTRPLLERPERRTSPEAEAAAKKRLDVLGVHLVDKEIAERRARRKAWQRDRERAGTAASPTIEFNRRVQRLRHRRWLRRLPRTLAACLGYLGLTAIVGVGVTAGTNHVQGALTVLVLLVAGIAILAGVRWPRSWLANALLGSFAGTIAGLALAAAAGVAALAAAGPTAGWPAFWLTWFTGISIGTALGAME